MYRDFYLCKSTNVLMSGILLLIIHKDSNLFKLINGYMVVI